MARLPGSGARDEVAKLSWALARTWESSIPIMPFASISGMGVLGRGLNFYTFA